MDDPSRARRHVADPLRRLDHSADRAPRGTPAAAAGLRLFLLVFAEVERGIDRISVTRPRSAADDHRPLASLSLLRNLLAGSRSPAQWPRRSVRRDLHGEADITAMRAQGGCFLFGAHVGSFEVVRAVGRHIAEAKTSLVMYEDNARKTNAVLHAINPELAMQIIGLGKPGSMLAVRDRLNEGYLVGLLADRSLATERQVPIPFLGAPARFPVGPFRMAAMLGRPVLLMLGLRRGDRRYDIVFETIAAEPAEDQIEAMMRRYVERLEYYCRSAPYNWFNFYDFWA